MVAASTPTVAACIPYGCRYAEAEAAAQAGLALDPSSAPLKELLDTARIETSETPEVQAQMHSMRMKRRGDEKMKKMLSGLNLGGNVQMFNGMGGLGGGMGGMGGLEGLFGGGGGGGGNFNAPSQTDDQMRMMARAMSNPTPYPYPYPDPDPYPYPYP